MNPSLPNSIHFKSLSFFLSIPPFNISNWKLFLLVAVNLLLLLMEAIMQYTLRKEIFAYVEKPVLMVVDSVSIIGPLLSHALLVLESLLKKKTDLSIWRQINCLNTRAGPNSSSFEKKFHRDFLLMSTVPLGIEVAVVLATYRTQENWALGLLSRHYSGVVNRWCILVFIYYMRYISDRIALIAEEIEHLHDLGKDYKYSDCIVVGKLYQMKSNFNMVWCLHGFAKNRYQVFLVPYFFMNLCGLTGSMYFLGTRLVTRRFPYTLESALCLGPYLFTCIHMSVVAADFGSKQGKLLEALHLLSEENWRNPKVVNAIKSFKIQLKLANLTPTIGGHLNVDSSSFILGVTYTVLTYVFIFLFLN